MIEIYKLLTGKYDTNVTFNFEKNIKIVKPGGGHNLMLVNHRCHYYLSKFFLFTNFKSESLAGSCHLC